MITLYKVNNKEIGLQKLTFIELVLINIPISIILFLLFIAIGSSNPKIITKTTTNTTIIHDTLQQLVVLRSGLTEIILDRNKNIAKFCYNPGNIRPGNKQIDALAIGTISSINGEFLYFPSEEQGFKALEILLQTKYAENTIQECISMYAPPCENNTSKYIQTICNKLNKPSTTKIKDLDIKKLSKEIAIIEGYY
jgi:hypothetical protein